MSTSPGNAKENQNTSRDGRLILRKTNEEVLRKILQGEARKKCLTETNEFGACAKEHGMWVVLQCRQKNAVMQSCLENHYNEEIFSKFLEDNGHPPVNIKPSLSDRVSSIFGK